MANYYEEREHISKAISNYQGSVYWVQGMQDWNVDPHQVFPWYQMFIDAGFDVRGMLGQWEHNYPDQWTKHNNQDSGYGGEAIHNMTRWDWGQDLFEWFEYYLKGIGEKPALHAQIQRNDGQWRIEPTWPPEDHQWNAVDLEGCAKNGNSVQGVSGGGATLASVIFECDALDSTSDTLISGLATLHLDVQAAMDGGQIFAELQDAETGLRLGHATMDIRYYQGGSDPTTVLPGQTLTMLMEFQAIDAILPAGHGVRLVLTETGEDYLAPACGVTCPITVNGGTLSIPHLDRDGSNVLITPQGEDAANNQ
jgi:predicted acyl esterase